MWDNLGGNLLMYEAQLRDLEIQADAFLSALLETAEAQLRWQWAQADAALAACLTYCSDYYENQCSGFLCSLGHIGCRTGCYSPYSAATSAAYVANRAALILISAEYAAFYAGQRAGIETGKILADALVLDEHDRCVQAAAREQCPDLYH